MRIERPWALVNETGIISLAANLDGEPLLAVGGHEGPIKVWKLQEKKSLLATLIGHGQSVNALAWERGGRLASGSSDGTVRVWAGGTQAVHVLRGHGLDVTDVCWGAMGILGSCGLDGCVILWNAVNGQKIQLMQGGDGGWLKGLSVTDSSTGIALYGDGRLLTLTSSSSSNNQPKPLWGVTSVSNDKGRNAPVVDLRKKDERNFYDTPKEVAYSRRPSQAGKLTALPLGQRGKKNHFGVVYRDGVPGEKGHCLLGHKTRVTQVCFSPWEYRIQNQWVTLLAVSSQDGTVSVWVDAERAIVVVAGLINNTATVTDISWREKFIFISDSEGSVVIINLDDLPAECRLRGSQSDTKTIPSGILNPSNQSSQPESFTATGKRRVQPTLLGGEPKRICPEFPTTISQENWSIANNGETGWILSHENLQVGSGPGSVSLLALNNSIDDCSGGVSWCLAVEDPGLLFSLVFFSNNNHIDWLLQDRVKTLSCEFGWVVFSTENGDIGLVGGNKVRLLGKFAFQIKTLRLTQGDDGLPNVIVETVTSRSYSWSWEWGGFMIQSPPQNDMIIA